MSKEALAKVVQRAISDAGFRRQLNSDPAGALRGFDLSKDELSAIRTGDAGRLSTLGVDQRMSKAFALGAVAGATRMAASDLSAGSDSMIDDGSGAGGRTIIPHDPEAAATADSEGGAASKSVINDDPDGFLAANAIDTGGSAARAARVGDDWKFDRTQGSVAPVEGSPEASAYDAANTSGGGMAAYPAHDGLAGPSGAQSVRAGDDWARTAASADEAGRAGAARLDDSGGASGGRSVINDDPDGFLAANARSGGDVVRANTINDDPDGFLAANAKADGGIASRGDGTAYVDESEAYLTKVGYDPNVTTNAALDAHERGSWSGDDLAGPSDSNASSEGNAGDTTDGNQITP
jgi:hypothetical protein